MTKENLTARCQLLCDSTDNVYPINKLRSFIFSKFGIWDAWDVLPRSWRYYYYDNIKPIFSPCHSKLRKSIPRTWQDLSQVVLDVNFQIIRSFYEDEYSLGIINWEADEHHKEFAEWLELSYKWITQRRSQLQIDLEKAYPPYRPIDKMLEPIEDENGRKMFRMIDDDIPYDVKYAEVNRIEKIIEDKDTEIVIALIKYRSYLWT